MSLPLNYSNSLDYFEDTLSFLDKYQWIYNFSNTHILVKNILNYFPCDWLEYFQNLSNYELPLYDFNDVKNCPNTLKTLLRKISTLKPNLNYENLSEEVHLSHNCGLNDKKRHEIICLAPIINKICSESENNIVIDVGSGLGYLSHYLNFKYGYKVLGIDCSKQFINLALKNQEKFYPKSETEVIFKEHYITSESSVTIGEILKTNFNSIGLKSSSIVGLHACADLSINILEIFTKLDFLKSLVIMPCCYHRIKLEKTTKEEEFFYNYPMSNVFKNLYEKFEAQKFLRRPFLRLACQQTMAHFIAMSPEEHEKRSKSLMFRCILQEVAEDEKCLVKRLKRKSNTRNFQNSNEDLEIYLNNLQNSHCLITPSNDEINISEDFLEKMRLKWLKHKDKCYLIEVLTGFQAAIQSICENIILLDRVEYLKEKGLKASIEKVTDDLLSPRCHALIALKTD